MHMKNSTISKPWSYLIDLVSTDAVKSRRRSTLWLMLFTLLLLPTSMVAQTDYDTSVTFSALAGSPEGFDNEKYPNLFDGLKYRSNSTKWCGKFVSNGGTYVIFEASKAGIPVGYTITTGNDNSTYKGRNPRSWKLYGNNEGKNGAWTLIQEVSNDTKLQDVNCASYDFTCEGSTPYKYFKWEITGIRNKDYIQVGEFELKLNTGYQIYAEFDEGTGTLTFKYGPSTSKPEGAYDLNVGPNTPKWLAQKEKIKTVVFDASFANARPTSCYGWFWQCLNLNTIEGIEYLNTEKVTIMNSMFLECKALTSLDLTNFNTMNVTNMISMFGSCSALTTIYVSEKFVTNQVTNIYSRNMFYGCEKLNGYDDSKIDHTYANYKTGYFTKLVGKNGDEKIGASGEILTAESLTLDDDKDFVVYEPFAAKNAFYIRVIPEGSKWGTLCLPFAIDQSKETGCKFYSLTGIDNDCITLESYEEGAEIPAGTPVLFKMNEGVQELEISAQNAELVKEPVAGTNTDVNLVGSFTKIGGKDNQGLTDTDYIIGKDKFWLVSELKKDGNGVGIKPMRAYIHPANESQARAAMLSIGKGDGTTAIDNLNAISNDANAEYYDANGRRTNGLQKGLNIVKRGSKTYKIMVK